MKKKEKKRSFKLQRIGDLLPRMIPCQYHPLLVVVAQPLLSKIKVVYEKKNRLHHQKSMVLQTKGMRVGEIKAVIHDYIDLLL